MPVAVRTSRFGRLALIEALEMWSDVHTNYRDEQLEKVKAAMSGGRISEMADAASEANVMNTTLEAAAHLLSQIRAMPLEQDVVIQIREAPSEPCIQALEHYTDMLTDMAFDAIPVLQVNEVSVTLTREDLIKSRKELDETIQKLTCACQILGTLQGYRFGR